MWYKNSNGDSVKPADVDSTSSKVYVYVRKDFTLIPAQGEGEHANPEHWEWLEQKVKKEDWELYQTVTGHTSELSDVEDALMELAEMIVEG